MKSEVRRRTQQGELRERILDSARELFAREGIEAVSMRKIAQNIGYTATTLYNHFADKEALLMALCDADFLSLRKSFGRIGRIADPIERLRKLGRAYIDFAVKHPSHYRLMFMTPRPSLAEEPGMEIEKGNPDQDAYAFLRATVVEGMEAGLYREEYTDPDLLAQVIWSSVHGVASLHLVLGKDTWCPWRPVKDVAGEVIEATIRGVARRPVPSGGDPDD